MGAIHFVRQEAPNECGVAALHMIAEFFLGKELCYQEVRRLCMLTAYGMNVRNLCRAAGLLGLKTLPIWYNAKNYLQYLPIPCISIIDNIHYIVITKIGQNHVEIINPAVGYLSYNKDEFIHRCFFRDSKQGIFILFEKS
jgi:ATP-binding cassette subfamily B protein